MILVLGIATSDKKLPDSVWSYPLSTIVCTSPDAIVPVTLILLAAASRALSVAAYSAVA